MSYLITHGKREIRPEFVGDKALFLFEIDKWVYMLHTRSFETSPASRIQLSLLRSCMMGTRCIGDEENGQEERPLSLLDELLGFDELDLREVPDMDNAGDVLLLSMAQGYERGILYDGLRGEVVERVIKAYEIPIGFNRVQRAIDSDLLIGRSRETGTMAPLTERRPAMMLYVE